MKLKKILNELSGFGERHSQQNKTYSVVNADVFMNFSSHFSDHSNLIVAVGRSFWEDETENLWGLQSCCEKVKPKWVVFEPQDGLPLKMAAQNISKIRKVFSSPIGLLMPDSSNNAAFLNELGLRTKLPIYLKGNFDINAFDLERVHFVEGHVPNDHPFAPVQLASPNPISAFTTLFDCQSQGDDVADFQNIYDIGRIHNWGYWPMFLKDRQADNDLIFQAEVQWSLFESFFESESLKPKSTDHFIVNPALRVIAHTPSLEELMEEWGLSTDQTEDFVGLLPGDSSPKPHSLSKKDLEILEVVAEGIGNRTQIISAIGEGSLDRFGKLADAEILLSR